MIADQTGRDEGGASDRTLSDLGDDSVRITYIALLSARNVLTRYTLSVHALSDEELTTGGVLCNVMEHVVQSGNIGLILRLVREPIHADLNDRIPDEEHIGPISIASPATAALKVAHHSIRELKEDNVSGVRIMDSLDQARGCDDARFLSGQPHVDVHGLCVGDFRQPGMMDRGMQDSR